MRFFKFVFYLFAFCIFNCVCSNVYEHRECDSNSSFKCYNGGVCLQINKNSSAVIRVCSCKSGFTGRQCEQHTMPCSPDPCAPNGYCNSDTTDSNKYICRCKPGFTGVNCKENINDCVNSECLNGGLCIDGVNTYTCDCPWPYTGRYCETLLNCDDLNQSFCKNNATCVITDDKNVKCVCKEGYQGVDCSTKTDNCHAKPCLFGGKCVSLTSLNDYRCDCPFGRLGKNCELMDVCAIQKPCKHNSTCIQIDSNDYDIDSTAAGGDLTVPKYVCECRPGYTGYNCDVIIDDCVNGDCEYSHHQSSATLLSKIVKITTTPSTISSSNNDSDTTISQSSALNGSFVLILNLTPDEFKRRKAEIIQEFSKQMGIFMLIKKDSNSQEMIYPYEYQPANKDGQLNSKQLWTKVYFIIIFACIDQQHNAGANSGPSKVTNPNNICLNDLNNLNEIFNFVKELKHSNNLPNYVSNITYEANEIKSGYQPTDRAQPSALANVTTAIVVAVVVVLAVVVILIGVIVKLQKAKQKLVKAPVWFPPYPSGDKLDVNTNHPSNSVTPAPQSNTPSQWSFMNNVKAFFKADSPSSDENYSSTSSTEPLKPKRESSTPLYQVTSSSSTSSDYLGAPSPPDYYPSPPESLPDFYVNVKGPSGLTPLMCVIMNKKANNTLELIDALVAKGADLNAQDVSNGETALHMAARCGLYDICEKLINYGADITVFDKNGRTVLHTAVGSNQISIIKLLYQKCGGGTDKFDLDMKTSDQLGETPLVTAARMEFNELVKILINMNATINATDNNGQSALHLCARVNNCQGAILLLENGANINLQDDNEKTPLSCALDELHTNEIIQLLIKYQAFVSSDDEKLIELKQQRMQTKFNFKDIKPMPISNEKQVKITNLMTTNTTTTSNSVANTTSSGNSIANRKRKANNDGNNTTKTQRPNKSFDAGSQQLKNANQLKLQPDNSLYAAPSLPQLNENALSHSIQENIHYLSTSATMPYFNTYNNAALSNSLHSVYQPSTYQQQQQQQQQQQSFHQSQYSSQHFNTFQQDPHQFDYFNQTYNTNQPTNSSQFYHQYDQLPIVPTTATTATGTSNYVAYF